MRGLKKNYMKGDRKKYRHISGHCDSMNESVNYYCVCSDSGLKKFFFDDINDDHDDDVFLFHTHIFCMILIFDAPIY